MGLFKKGLHKKLECLINMFSLNSSFWEYPLFSDKLLPFKLPYVVMINNRTITMVSIP